MDPDKTLRIMLGISRAFVRGEYIEMEDAIALGEAVQNLDQWLAKGGFLPERWERK